MSIARFHAEWLSLIEISGPFLSLPVLVRRFPQGLEAHDPEHCRLLRQVHDEWDDNQQGLKPDPAIHTQWIKWVLRNTLELDEVLVEGQQVPQTLKTLIEEPQNRETLRPDMVLLGPDKKTARLLIHIYPLRQKLTRVVEGRAWKASPDTRMAQLLRDTGIQLGLVTNGDQWMLVYAPKGETSGYTSWYSTLWLEEQKTLSAFRTLLGLHRFFGVPDDETLESLLAESAADQQEVTDQLGYQVRMAVEVLVHSLDKSDQDYGGKLLEGVPDSVLYEASLTVMMRLVFLFCAEERELLLLGDELYDLNYAVSTLREQLRTTADNYGEEILERRNDAWSRLLTTFRVVYGGVQHERMKLPAYGGSLFDPDRFPFLEGRQPKTSWRGTPSQPLPINNRTVLHLLEALQVLQVKLPGGGPAEPRKLSFRALGIEQIGHVYEGLLDHTAIRATEPVLGLSGTRDKEPEVPLSQLEELAAKSEKGLLEFLKKETGRSSVATIKKMLDAKLDDQAVNRFRTACHSDEGLWKRIEPFAGLVRMDTFGYPVVIVLGSVYVTAGTDRRSSGTHYTPRSLTEPIVQYTLEPLVYEGPAEGTPKGEWQLKSAAELLELKICDMACGSGAFLVQACRYMSERLVEAWETAEKQVAGSLRITPTGNISEGGPREQLIPTDTEERHAYARRIVAQRCLYGVDVNYLAAEMAKLSLWLLTLAKDKPFEFLDHAIRCGDSLVGIHDIEQLKHFSLKPNNDDTPLFKGPLDRAVEEAINLRLRLERMPANTVEDIEAQEKLLAEAEDKISRLRCAGDLLVAAEFWGKNTAERREKLRQAAALSSHYIENRPTDEFQEKANKERRGQKMFHWPLEFPEVIVKRRGFDAFVGNPPFMGGKIISTSFGAHYAALLREHYADAQNTADLCAYFFQRCFALSNTAGTFGLLATNSLAQGDTAEAALRYPVVNGSTIYRAERSFRWPGTANVFASQAFVSRAAFESQRILDNIPVAHISHRLLSDDVEGEPLPLKVPPARAFVGSFVRGDGFILTTDEADRLIQEDPQNRSVIFPYLNGADLYSNAECSANRCIINFFDWPIEKARQFAGPFAIVEVRVKPFRDGVKEKAARELWWQYAGLKAELYLTTSRLSQALVRARVSDTHAIVLVQANQVFSDALVIFGSDNMAILCVLQSTVHESWSRKYGSTLKGDMRYSPTDCFDNFVFPPLLDSLSRVGFALNERRSTFLHAHKVGLTALYHRFHDPGETETDIERLRELHVEMDQAVAAAYGWNDLILLHDFYEIKQEVRFTISEPARREVLQRLLTLNHERYEEEFKKGLHGKKNPARGKPTFKKRSVTNKAETGPVLFGNDD